MPLCGPPSPLTCVLTILRVVMLACSLNAFSATVLMSAGAGNSRVYGCVPTAGVCVCAELRFGALAGVVDVG